MPISEVKSEKSGVVVVVVVKQHHPFASFCHTWPLGTLSTNDKMRVRTKIDLGSQCFARLDLDKLH
jgi:hypothetical protein